MLVEARRQQTVAIRDARAVSPPQHEVSVFAGAGDELGRFRNRDGINLVGMAPQDACCSPVASFPEADRLIAPRREQLFPVFGKHKFGHPSRVSLEPATELAGGGLPEANSRVQESRTCRQHFPVRRDGQGGQAELSLLFGLPKLSARREVDALDAALVAKISGTRQV